YVHINGFIYFNLIQINVWSFINQNDSNLNLISTLSVKQSQFRYQRRPAKDDFIPTSSMICLDLGHLTFKGGKINILNLEENYSIYVPIKIQLRKIQFLF
ncbi:unnamed protein product, partial [Rotaria sordida]